MLAAIDGRQALAEQVGASVIAAGRQGSAGLEGRRPEAGLVQPGTLPAVQSLGQSPLVLEYQADQVVVEEIITRCLLQFPELLQGVAETVLLDSGDDPDYQGGNGLDRLSDASCNALRSSA